MATVTILKISIATFLLKKNPCTCSVLVFLGYTYKEISIARFQLANDHNAQASNNFKQ